MRTAAALLLVLAAAAHLIFGAAAIAGVEALEDNVRDIEASPGFGDLYLSLSGWGVVLGLVGLLELAAGVSLIRARPAGRLLGLTAALLGLGASFFTLALFRVPALGTVVLTLAALYVLSYRVHE